MNTNKPIYALHADHTEWLNKLSFYQDELTVMQSRIEEVSAKNSSPDVTSFIESFQNQLIIQKEQVDILKHEINQEEATLENAVKNNPVAVDHRKMPDQEKLREQMESFEKIFADLRKTLAEFIAKWL